MIRVQPASARFHAEQDWLQSNFSFSFGPYFDRDNTAFGPMRVLNDDFVAAGRGFGAHPHSDMEVVSIVLKGAMRHKDNIGNDAVTSFGEVQLMSAGLGIIHTEFNASDSEELNLLQMWFMPTKRGLQPTYHTSRFDVDALENQLLPVVVPGEPPSPDDPVPAAARIHQDMTIYLGRLQTGTHLALPGAADRRGFLFVIEGRLHLGSGELLEARDAARVENEESVSVTADESALLMWIDLP